MEQIVKLEKKGVTDFFSGMAEGVDTWAAMAVLERRKENPNLRLHCILPCPGQEEKWSPSSQERYRWILAQADSLTYVSTNFCKDCYLKRNRYLVDAADILLAVYDGSKRSGTGATVRYAQKRGKKIIKIDPITLIIDDITKPPKIGGVPF